MNVQTILSAKGTEVATISPTASLADAVDMLGERGFGALVVSADGASLDGIVSERDIVRALADRRAARIERNPTVSRRRIARHQRRLVLASGIEDEPRPGFDDHVEPQALTECADRVDIATRRVKRIEVLHVQREPDTLVAVIGEQTQRVVEPVALQTVGVVAEQHGISARSSAS